MAAILVPARRLASMMRRRSSSSHALSSGVTSGQADARFPAGDPPQAWPIGAAWDLVDNRKILESIPRRQRWSTERETSAHRGHPGTAGQMRVPTIWRWDRCRAAGRFCGDVASRSRPAASPRAWLAGNSTAAPGPSGVERAGPEPRPPATSTTILKVSLSPSNKRAPRIF